MERTVKEHIAQEIRIAVMAQRIIAVVLQERVMEQDIHVQVDIPQL